MTSRLEVRVIHAAAYGGPYPGSFIPMLLAARAAVRSRGWRFEVVFSPGVEGRGWYRELEAAGVEMHVPPPMDTRAASRWLRMLAADRTRRAVLHSHFTDWDVPVALAAAASPTAAVWQIHSWLSPDRLIRVRNTVRFGLLGRLVDLILCVSPEVRAQVVERLAPAGRTELFPNAIDVERFSPRDAGARSAARARFGLDADAAVLVLFAYDWENKGGRLLLETVRELAVRGRPVLALIVGAPAAGHRDTRALGLEAQVRLIDPLDQVRELYATADVFVAASAGEGMPLSVLEALCSGVPVVASDIASHRFVAASMPGCRLAARHPAAFADAVQSELDANPRERMARLARSRAYAQRELSVSAWADRLLTLYDGVLGRRRVR